MDDDEVMLFRPDVPLAEQGLPSPLTVTEADGSTTTYA